MKRTALLLSLLAVIGCNSTSEKKEETSSTTTKVDTTAAAKPAETPPPPMDSAAMMKAMQEYMTPGEMHKWMASMNGKWDAQVISWWTGPGKADTSKASGENKMVMGGRYQQINFKGMMNGMPFEGLGMMGYDNAKQKFVSTWIDNMGTGIMEMEGTYDPSTKTMNMSGKMTDPATKKDCDVREVFTMTDDKHQTMEMYSTQPGQKEMKMMEIHYTKK